MNSSSMDNLQRNVTHEWRIVNKDFTRSLVGRQYNISICRRKIQPGHIRLGLGFSVVATRRNYFPPAAGRTRAASTGIAKQSERFAPSGFARLAREISVSPMIKYYAIKYFKSHILETIVTIITYICCCVGDGDSVAWAP